MISPTILELEIRDAVGQRSRVTCAEEHEPLAGEERIRHGDE